MLADPVIEGWHCGTVAPTFVREAEIDTGAADALIGGVDVIGASDAAIGSINVERGLALDPAGQTRSEHCSHRPFRAVITIDAASEHDGLTLLARLRARTDAIRFCSAADLARSAAPLKWGVMCETLARTRQPGTVICTTCHEDVPAMTSTSTAIRSSAPASGRLRVQPAIAGRVIELMIRNDGGLTEVIEADPALCAVVVRAANSVHLGLSRRVGGVRQAMVMLGQDATTALAVARTADLVFEPDDTSPSLAPWAWPQAVAAARAAALLAPSMDANPEHAYTAGLLQNLPMMMGARHDAEHSGACARLLEGWNFPDTIVSAVRNHHRSLDDVVAPLDRIVVCARTLAAEAGLADSRPVAPMRDVIRAADLGRTGAASLVKEVERSLDVLIRLAGVK